MASAATGWSRMAMSERPTRPRSRFQPSTNITSAIASVKKYSHWSAFTGRPKGGSGFMITMPWTPPVQCSRPWDLSSGGIDTPSANVARAR